MATAESEAGVAAPAGRGRVPGTADSGAGLGFTRTLAWVALVLVPVLAVGLSTYIGIQAKRTLLSKQQEFASFLAENLDHQIYRRFTLPTLVGFGPIDLPNSFQYDVLDRVVKSTFLGLDVQNIRIYGHDRTITYSTDKEEAGRRDMIPEQVEPASASVEPIFVVDEDIPYWKAYFSLDLPEDSFRLRTFYPFGMQNRSSTSGLEGPALGVLEFTQDITQDIKRSIRFQQVIFIVTLLSSSLLVALLFLFIRRAERAVAARMAEEQRLINELHQSEKLAGMGRVVAGIAHEIRNPLGIIRSSSELLLKRGEGKDELTVRILRAIYDEACRLSRTVGDFLDYARPREAKKDPVDVRAVMTEVLAFFGPELTEREIEVVHSGKPDVPLTVRGDKDLIYRAFYNIVGNAVQAVGRAGTITVGLSKEGRRPARVVVTVRDTGPGIPPDMLDKILDPFVTTKDDGTGLGLPIVANIVAGHGGVLNLANAESGGALIRIELPVE